MSQDTNTDTDTQNNLDTPVVLLHGAGGHHWSLYPLKWYLEYRIGYQNVHIVQYSTFCTLDDAIQQVDEQLTQMIDKTRTSIIVIGQSKGGVIGFHLHEKGWQLEKLITIASPIRGAQFVTQLKNTIPRTFKFLAHRPCYDDFEKRCHQEITTPPHPCHSISTSLPFTNNWPFQKVTSGFDGCVYEEEAVIHPENHHHIPWSHHALVIMSPRLYYRIHQIMTQ